LTLSLMSIPSMQTFQLVLFDDEEASFPSIYPYAPGQNCSHWIGAAKAVIPVMWGSDGRFLWNTTISQQARPRFWYAMIVTCDEQTTVPMVFQYNLHMYHGHLSYWSKEFGMNEMGMNTAFVTFLAIYTILLLVQAGATAYFWGQEKYIHPLLRLLFCAVLFHWIYCVFKVAFYVHFSFNGEGEWAVSRLGDFFYIIMRSLFIFMLLLLASGYSIVESTGQIREKRLIFCTVVLLTIVWILLQIWENHIIPREEVGLHTHIKVILNILLVVWLCVGTLFCWLARQSHTKVPTTFIQSQTKKDFFVRLGIFYGVWFLSLPLITVIAQVLDPWVRLKLVTTFTLCETLVGVLALMWLMWPTRASKYFDFSGVHGVRLAQGYDNLVDDRPRASEGVGL